MALRASTIFCRRPIAVLVGRLAFSSTAPSSSAAAAAGPAAGSGFVRLVYEQERPKLVVALGKSGPGDAFSIRPNRPVSSFLLDLEDTHKGAQEPALLDGGGRVVSRSTTLDDALVAGASLRVNGKVYPITFPTLEERLQFKHQEAKNLEEQLVPLEKLKNECDRRVNFHVNSLTWLGFGGLCAQWGLMMRLTWFDYSWDVMEPIAYFVSFGTGILGYFFYLVTRQDYTYEALSGHTSTRRQRKEYVRRGLDLQRYQSLRDSLTAVQADIENIKRHHALTVARP